MEYIASLSYGKDSLHMLEVIHQSGLPLDRIIHAEIMATATMSANLPPIVEFKDKADRIIKQRYGIEVERVRAKVSYNDVFYTVKQRGKRRGEIYGFPWILGSWCIPMLKTSVLDKGNRGAIKYIGYTDDEKSPARQKKIREYNDGTNTGKLRYPLVDYNITEQNCFDWCENNDLLSPTYKTSIRDGCWFCHKQPLQQLFYLYTEYPERWQMLLAWEKDTRGSFTTSKVTIEQLTERFRQGFVYKKDMKNANQLKLF